MIVLDTDHLSALHQGGPTATRLLARLQAADQDTVITIITVEERIQGWMAEINKAPTAEAKVAHYAKLQQVVIAFGRWNILPFDLAAAARYDTLRTSLRRMGSLDLMIAAIALNHDALLLSANLRDFRPVPGLRVEDWIH